MPALQLCEDLDIGRAMLSAAVVRGGMQTHELFHGVKHDLTPMRCAFRISVGCEPAISSLPADYALVSSALTEPRSAVTLRLVRNKTMRHPSTAMARTRRSMPTTRR